jgi:hypothetical protein
VRVQRITGVVGATWGALGVLALLLFAIYRLGQPAVAAIEAGLTPGEWLAAVAITLFMAYAEGYRGFQLKFSPRTAARIRYLRDRPDPVRSLLAPLVAMGYLHATRRRRIGSVLLTLGIILAIVLVRQLDATWRGIVDAGVVVGLIWGVVSLVFYLVRALARERYDVSPEVP